LKINEKSRVLQGLFDLLKPKEKLTRLSLSNVKDGLRLIKTPPVRRVSDFIKKWNNTNFVGKLTMKKIIFLNFNFIKNKFFCFGLIIN